MNGEGGKVEFCVGQSDPVIHSVRLRFSLFNNSSGHKMPIASLVHAIPVRVFLILAIIMTAVPILSFLIAANGIEICLPMPLASGLAKMTRFPGQAHAYFSTALIACVMWPIYSFFHIFLHIRLNGSGRLVWIVYGEKRASGLAGWIKCGLYLIPACISLNLLFDVSNSARLCIQGGCVARNPIYFLFDKTVFLIVFSACSSAVLVWISASIGRVDNK